MKRALLVVMAFALLRCAATVPVARHADDEAAKHFTAAPNKAAIYIVRQASYKGKAILFQVSVDGKLLGGIAAGTYYEVEIDPGTHNISALSGENQSSLEVSADAGSVHFVQTQVRWGWGSARVELEEVPAGTGKQLVTEGVMAAGVEHHVK
jgi:hypothetical protein